MQGQGGTSIHLLDDTLQTTPTRKSKESRYPSCCLLHVFSLLFFLSFIHCLLLPLVLPLLVCLVSLLSYGGRVIENSKRTGEKAKTVNKVKQSKAKQSRLFILCHCSLSALLEICRYHTNACSPGAGGGCMSLRHHAYKASEHFFF